ncbi:hypothetical protein [Shewanella surugensis]|uniref:Uncharacterized protein n=1 Tax=Shewanella surugensis TaxID=212020 RepID=A0ABT0LIB7_9GAMM|nr:hypothetical protein [Shewanella surugensis]MCL1127215.1 hypothetical protein [Shewanella surugensis]
MMSSQYLTPRAYQGLTRLGDFLLPGTAQMPRFSETHCIEHVDSILSTTPKTDRDDLIRVLILVSILPSWVINRLLSWSGKASGGLAASQANKVTLWITTQLRLFDLGLRGVVFSLYYSGLNDDLTHTPRVYHAMDFQLHCQPLDTDKA